MTWNCQENELSLLQRTNRRRMWSVSLRPVRALKVSVDFRQKNMSWSSKPSLKSLISVQYPAASQFSKQHVHWFDCDEITLPIMRFGYFLKILSGSSATPRCTSRCAYGKILKILGHFLLKLLHSQYFQKDWGNRDLNLSNVFSRSTCVINIRILPRLILVLLHSQILPQIQPLTAER